MKAAYKRVSVVTRCSRQPLKHVQGNGRVGLCKATSCVHDAPSIRMLGWQRPLPGDADLFEQGSVIARLSPLRKQAADGRLAGHTVRIVRDARKQRLEGLGLQGETVHGC